MVQELEKGKEKEKREGSGWMVKVKELPVVGYIVTLRGKGVVDERGWKVKCARCLRGLRRLESLKSKRANHILLWDIPVLTA